MFAYFRPRIIVNFDRKVRDWDGFGVNYVEAAQTRDYAAKPQDYGGFSRLSEQQREEIIERVFGEDGLKPGLIKMFLDPYHQPEPGPDYDYTSYVVDPTAYDHTTTTRWMLHFVKRGHALMQARGDDLEIIVSLFGPPAWMTQQKFVRGRDPDPHLKLEIAKYMVAWAKHLREVENLPVKYISLNNEGEDWIRWPLDGSTSGTPNHDYNMYWPPELIVEFLKLTRAVLDANGLEDVGVTPGEPNSWYRFHTFGYADAIAEDDEALASLGLITSHGFFNGTYHKMYFHDWRSAGTDILREQRPELHAWTTSTTWRNMDAAMVEEMRNNIYAAKVNGLIPWAVIQTDGDWIGGDPNPGTAFKVFEDGHYETWPAYAYYKQICRAGQPGMAVCQALSNEHDIRLMAFARNGSKHPNAFVVINLADGERSFDVKVRGNTSKRFAAYRTSPDEQYVSLGIFEASEDGCIAVTAPVDSVTTFFEVEG